jgi:hypothetical protein
MKWSEDGFVNDKMVYSNAFLNCNAREEILKDIIKHEYCHAWADYGQKKSSHHLGRFIEKCNILKCGYTSQTKDKELNELYDKYLRELSLKKKSNKINYRKDIFNKITNGIRYKSEVSIRLKAIEKKGLYLINLTITEKYPVKELRFLFDMATKEIFDLLNNKNDINNITINNCNIDEIRKMNIYYMHKVNKN